MSALRMWAGSICGLPAVEAFIAAAESASCDVVVNWVLIQTPCSKCLSEHLAIRTKLESTHLNPLLSRNIPNSQSAIIAVSQTDRHSGVTLKNYSFDDYSEGLSLAVSSSDASGLGDALGLFSKVSCSFSA